MVDALCRKVPKDSYYELLCGRVEMARFGVYIDLGLSSWFVRLEKELQEMEVVYTAPELDPEANTCYIANIKQAEPFDYQASTVPEDQDFSGGLFFHIFSISHKFDPNFIPIELVCIKLLSKSKQR